MQMSPSARLGQRRRLLWRRMRIETEERADAMPPPAAATPEGARVATVGVTVDDDVAAPASGRRPLHDRWCPLPDAEAANNSGGNSGGGGGGGG
jgi:hypothetical protein